MTSLKLTDKNGMEGPTTATFEATDGLGRPIQIMTMESYTGAASCGALHPRHGWSCDLPKGHEGEHHATTLTPCDSQPPVQKTPQR